MGLSDAPSVVIAEDHAPTRASVRRVLEDDGLTVVAEVADAEHAIAACRAAAPAAAILDVRMPGSGLRAAEAIKKECPSIEVLMLTISDDDADLFAALAAGASGYWLKGQDLRLIPGLVRRILAGETILSASLVKPIVQEWRERRSRSDAAERFPGARLSAREREVVELLAEGRTTAEISERLFIAEVTVRTHIAVIVKKLRVRDRGDILELLRTPVSDGA